jgi:hypothetical protein
MSSDLRKALLADGSALSLLALAHIERQEDFIAEVDRRISALNAEIDLMADMGVTKIVAPNINCILALEEAGMPSAASILRRMK